MGYYNTFIVKIWCNDDGEMNRGYVQHVGTQEQRYFLDMDGLTDFIRGHLVLTSHDSGISEQTWGKNTPVENVEDVLQDGR